MSLDLQRSVADLQKRFDAGAKDDVAKQASQLKVGCTANHMSMVTNTITRSSSSALASTLPLPTLMPRTCLQRVSWLT